MRIPSRVTQRPQGEFYFLGMKRTAKHHIFKPQDVEAAIDHEC